MGGRRLRLHVGSENVGNSSRVSSIWPLRSTVYARGLESDRAALLCTISVANRGSYSLLSCLSVFSAVQIAHSIRNRPRRCAMPTQLRVTRKRRFRAIKRSNGYYMIGSTSGVRAILSKRALNPGWRLWLQRLSRARSQRTVANKRDTALLIGIALIDMSNTTARKKSGELK